MGCSFLAPLQDIVGKVADIAAPIAAAIPGPWQVPAMAYMTVTTVQNGGNLADVVKKIGTSYIMGQFGSAVSGAASSAAAGAGASATTASTIGGIASGVARAAVTGGDPLQALITGGIGAGVSELSGQIPGFSDLPPLAQRAASTAMSSALQGKDPTQALVSQALSAGVRAASDYVSLDPTLFGAVDPRISNSIGNAIGNAGSSAIGAMSKNAAPIGTPPTSPPVQDISPTSTAMGTPQEQAADATIFGMYDPFGESIFQTQRHPKLDADSLKSAYNIPPSLRAAEGGSIDDLMDYLRN